MLYLLRFDFTLEYVLGKKRERQMNLVEVEGLKVDILEKNKDG